MNKFIRFGIILVLLGGLSWNGTAFASAGTLSTKDSSIQKQEKHTENKNIKDTSGKKEEVKAVDAKDKIEEKLSGKKIDEKIVKKEDKTKLKNVVNYGIHSYDFGFWGNVYLGGKIDPLVKKLGEPKKQSSQVYDVYSWDKVTAKVSSDFLLGYMKREDLPVNQVLMKSGISDIVVKDDSLETMNGISVGDLRENVIRRYGKPSKILWDGSTNDFFYVYQWKNKMMQFRVHNDKVSEITMKFVNEDLENRSYDDVAKKDELPAKDFKLAGYTLHTAFKEHGFGSWEKSMENATDEVFYYAGYAVRIDKKSKLIQSLFLTDHRMVTPRGITIGDDVETVGRVYGAPHKTEINNSQGYTQNVFIYFSPEDRDILLIYLKNNKVDGIIAVENPQYKKESHK